MIDCPCKAALADKDRRINDLLLANVRFETAERDARWALADARAAALSSIKDRLIAAAAVHSKAAADNVDAMFATIEAEEKVRRG